MPESSPRAVNPKSVHPVCWLVIDQAVSPCVARRFESLPAQIRESRLLERAPERNRPNACRLKVPSTRGGRATRGRFATGGRGKAKDQFANLPSIDRCAEALRLSPSLGVDNVVSCWQVDHQPCAIEPGVEDAVPGRVMNAHMHIRELGSFSTCELG